MDILGDRLVNFMKTSHRAIDDQLLLPQQTFESRRHKRVPYPRTSYCFDRFWNHYLSCIYDFLIFIQQDWNGMDRVPGGLKFNAWIKRFYEKVNCQLWPEKNKYRLELNVRYCLFHPKSIDNCRRTGESWQALLSTCQECHRCLCAHPIFVQWVCLDNISLYAYFILILPTCQQTTILPFCNIDNDGWCASKSCGGDILTTLLYDLPLAANIFIWSLLSS